jgi:Txe/YoeB family toxin of Txe-Axe toxin-antitoxin module
LGLYLLIPSRRLEWRKVIIKSIKPQEENNNYLLLTDNSIDIVFNDYKTSKIYGEQTIKIEDDYLNKLIKKYIEEKELKEDDLLISQEGNKQKEINEGNFSRRVREVFRKVYNRDITIRFIRISHIVKFNRENIGCRMIDRRRLSEKMGHSIEEQLRYNKIF